MYGYGYGKRKRKIHVHHLPDELILMIFDKVPPHELLGAVSQVCRRWAALAAQRALLAERPARLHELRRRPRVRGVRVLTRLTNSLLNEFLLKAQYLQDITICNASPLSSDHFQALSHMQHLQHLDVFLNNGLLDASTVPIVSRLRSLVVNEMVALRVFSALADSERLEALHMYGRSLYFPRHDLMKLLDLRSSYLKELTLRCTELNDNNYTAIGQCESLVVLQLYSCWLMTAAGAVMVARPPRLRRLHVTGARMLRTSGLTTFLGHLPASLEELVLSVSAFGDEHVQALVYLPNLHTLELWRCQLSGEGVLRLANNVSTLRVLDLDIMLTNNQIAELDRHPGLCRVRCLTEHPIKSVYSHFDDYELNEEQKIKTTHIKIQDTNERYANKYFRSSGEGYQGSLFYFWTQKMDLQPLPKKCVPGFDENDDFF